MKNFKTLKPNVRQSWQGLLSGLKHGTLFTLCLFSSISIASADVTIKPGQSIEVEGVKVTCTGSGRPAPAPRPAPPPKVEFDVFYCAKPRDKYILARNRYDTAGKLVAEGVEVFLADNRDDCYNNLKNRVQPTPPGWNFSCTCENHTWGPYNNHHEQALVKKVYGPNGLVGTIDLEVGQWDKNDPVCSQKINFTRANDPTCY